MHSRPIMKILKLCYIILIVTCVTFKICEATRLRVRDVEPRQVHTINQQIETILDKLFQDKYNLVNFDTGEHALSRNWLIYTPNGPRYVSDPTGGSSFDHNQNSESRQDEELLNHIRELHQREDLKPVRLVRKKLPRVEDRYAICRMRGQTLMNILDPLHAKFCMTKASRQPPPEFEVVAFEP